MTSPGVPTLTPGALEAGDLLPGESDPFETFGSLNIQRALSLVPAEVVGFFDLDIELYLPQNLVRDFDHDHRAISHAQLELVAARASALNGCYY